MRRRAVALADVALIPLFACAVLAEPHAFAGDPVTAPVWYGLLSLAPLAIRRKHPWTALGSASLLQVAPGLLSGLVPSFFGNQVPLYLLVYTVARHRDGPAVRCLATYGLALAGMQAVHTAAARSPGYVVFDALTFAVAWLVGRTTRRFDLQSLELEQTLDALAEQQRLREQLAVAVERSRLAAESHDVVGHAITLMVVQVGATRMQLERGTPGWEELAETEDLGRQALAELRRILGVLHSSAESDRSSRAGVIS